AAAAARRRAWPELSLRASYGLRGTLADGTPQDDMWSAGAAIDLPIGAGARQGSEAAEEVAMAAAAAAERQSETLELDAEIVAERGRATAAQHVVALLGDTVLVAQQRALDAAWSAYESGTTDLAGVLESAHASYAGELDLARAHEELARALSRLLAVTARGELLGVHVPPVAREGRRP
ncbi:MAG TPA: TolC family protein, partial [Candidatus Eisenbacteria bacterium]